MKHVLKSLIILLIISFLNSSCKKEENYMEIELIEYDVLINNFSYNYSWFDNIEGSKRLNLFDLILKSGLSGKFEIQNIDNVEIKPDQIQGLLNIEILNDSIKETITLNSNKLNGLRFREKWEINTKTSEITKTVIAICPLYFHKHILLENDKNEVFPIFWIFPNSELKSNDKYNLTDKIAFDVIIDNTNHLITDTYGNKNEFFFHNIEVSNRNNLVSIIFDAATNKHTKSYDFFFNELSDNEIKQTLIRNESVSIPDTLNIGLFIDQNIEIDIEKSDIQRIKFIEKWEIDKESLQFTKQVIAISPAYMVFGNNAEFRGFKSMFWLLFNEKEKKNMIFE